MSGQDVKKYILSQGVRLWQVAKILGVNDGNFSRRLRNSFSDEEFCRITAAVSEIKTSLQSESKQ